MDKQIIGLLKQNEAIYGSLKAKNVEGLGELAIPDSSLDLLEQKELLLGENARLKELVKVSKPLEEPKAKLKPTQEPNPKPAQPKVKTQDSDDENYEPPVPKFTTIGNMEDLKRAFFSGEYTQFEELVKASPYKFYTANYKFSSDKDGAPDYSARNLLKGFTRSFDDYRKYFLICFRCMERPGSNPGYTYPSLWIVNTLDPLDNVFGSIVDDFDFQEITDSTKFDEFLISIRKMNEEALGLIGEGYVH